jgi:signal transduction histidine kinase
MKTARTAGAYDIAALLRGVPLLRELPDAQLDALAQRVRRMRVPAGTIVMREGEPADGGLLLLVRGALEVTRNGGGEELLVGRLRAGEFVGEMALLGAAARTATVRACRRSDLLVIAPADFHDLLGTTPALRIVLRAVARRVAATEAALLQRQRLAALGTLAAGLAHELNNPAAAIAASALQLERRLPELEASARAAGAVPELSRFIHEVPSCDPDRAGADVERLAEWLRASGVRAADRAAHALTAAGRDLCSLQHQVRGVPPAQRRVLLELLAARSDAAALARDVLGAARAISGVVEGVRAQVASAAAPRRELSLRDSIAAALHLLRPRLGSMTVTFDAPDDALVHAHAGELSQVWTNLIGNAVDAVNGAGRMRIRLRIRAGRAVIEVCDDGPGIATDVRARIFEPFFTTKPAGDGMGLGLHVVRSIVVGRYAGRIDVRSRPGRTVFRVVLPLAVS